MNQYMKIIVPKFKYILGFILLLGTFLCGYNFKQWYVTNHRVKKHISLVYSFSRNSVGYGNFEKLITRELRKKGIEPIFNQFYLDCNQFNPEVCLDNINKYLDGIKSKPMDLILAVGDQATFSLLSTRHRLLSSIPVVACNVHFPDEKLIKEYSTKDIYILRDSPDFKSNIDFIQSLQPKAEIEIVYNIDLTTLGRKSYDLLTKVVDRRNVQILGHKSAYSMEYEYKEMNEMMKYYNLMAAVANDRIKVKKDKLTVSLCPFRYIKGASLLVMMEKSKSEQKKKAFLLDKFDSMSLPIVNAVNIPSFSCICEGFDEGTKIVGGYMATKEISAKVAADLSVQLMNKEKTGTPKISDLPKEYVLDWSNISAYGKQATQNIPPNVRLVNYPLYDHYRVELYLLAMLFILAFIIVSLSLLRMRKRSRIEHKNLQILEEAHKRLTLSTDGGQISLWNMQEDTIEFDTNYTRLMGLKQRSFTKDDFLQYAYPDDVQLLSSFYETLYQSPGMEIQRARFCFRKNEDDYQWYELRCRSLKNAQGEMILAGIMQNIQKLVEHEQQLILAKQMAEKAELKQSFLNNISHEIRTPLNAIVGFTNILAGEDADEIDREERESMLEIINLNNELLLKLINDMLEISHLDSGNIDFEMKNYDITEIVREIYKHHQPLIQPSLKFNLELDNSLFLPANIDRIRFTQVISNFLSNANKFTQCGSITLGCKIDKEHNEVCVYVKDTGKGIDEKELMMIFDRFYKADEFEQGSGLGLSICKVIIERLAGRIEVQSEVGIGSCFATILPLIPLS